MILRAGQRGLGPPLSASRPHPLAKISKHRYGGRSTTTTIPQDTQDTGQLQRKDDTHLGRDDVGRPHVLPLGPLLQCFARYSHGCDKCDGASKMKNEAACGLTVAPFKNIFDYNLPTPHHVRGLPRGTVQLAQRRHRHRLGENEK